MPVALLLEDEALIAMDLEMNLQSAGFSVVHFMSCEEADRWVSNHRPDIAVVDIILTDGSCHDVVSKLRQAEVPFIVHSGDGPEQHAGTPFEHGIWVNKPSQPDDLVAAALQAIGKGD